MKSSPVSLLFIVVMLVSLGTPFLALASGDPFTTVYLTAYPGWEYNVTSDGIVSELKGFNTPVYNANAWEGATKANTLKLYDITVSEQYQWIKGSISSSSSSDYSTHVEAWLTLTASDLGHTYVSKVNIKSVKIQLSKTTNIAGHLYIIGIDDNGNEHILYTYAVSGSGSSNYEFVINLNADLYGQYRKVKIKVEGDLGTASIIKYFYLYNNGNYILGDNATVRNLLNEAIIVNNQELGSNQEITVLGDTTIIYNIYCDVTVSDKEGNLINPSSLIVYNDSKSWSVTTTHITPSSLGLDAVTFYNYIMNKRLFVKYGNGGDILLPKTSFTTYNDSDITTTNIVADGSRAIGVYDQYGNELFWWLINSSQDIIIRDGIAQYINIYSYPDYSYLSTLYYNPSTGSTSEVSQEDVDVNFNFSNIGGYTPRTYTFVGSGNLTFNINQSALTNMTLPIPTDFNVYRDVIAVFIIFLVSALATEKNAWIVNFIVLGLIGLFVYIQWLSLPAGVVGFVVVLAILGIASAK